ncbi:MAG TPA: ABC transporter ATP-binding protein, partial [Acetobacteraceae bacterium]|nr:ABC transporter ATP-binding protein [Acetobacteraceae bacterium]
MTAPLLDISNLSVEFDAAGRAFKAVDEVSLQIAAGSSVGVVGESGSGKSLTALAILRLIPEPPGRISAGYIRFDGTDLLTLPREEMPDIRGSQIAMIFQEPMSSLNPVMTIGDQIGEVLYLHERLSRRERRARVIAALASVGIPAPEERIGAFPHQFSGGMRQRVMIAMALACNPKLLIADEPTTALDVTVQAQVLALIRQLRAERNTAVLFVSHDFGVIAEITERVVVLYAGKVMEAGEVREIFRHPAHPYTKALLQSIPRPDVEQ